jgi:hypothetical protein
MSRSPPGASFSCRAPSRCTGLDASTTPFIAWISATLPPSRRSGQTNGTTSSEKALPTSASPATGRAFSSAWNSQVFAQRS